jgi:glycosyltransferase involved in cell wall biosynthesis
MKILFLGWEFPPNSVGGLGTHTYEIVKSLSRKGVNISILLPFSAHSDIPSVRFYSADLAGHFSVYARMKPLFSAKAYNDVYAEMSAYTSAAVEIAKDQKFDIIHANDWITAPAGIKIKELSGKPLLLTMHSTENDRTIGHPWDFIFDWEKKAVNSADKVITVSNRLKDELTSIYGADPSRIEVIHNAIDKSKFDGHALRKNSKVILYVGRLSVQKGVDYLIRAFKTVSEHNNDAFLYVVGDGPQMSYLIDLTIDLNLSDKVIFFGRVPDDILENFYFMASVFVMPSVSEPFGITALEAIASRTPTIISAQSGVSEVIKNVFKVDFWDSKQMADILLGLLGYPAVKEEMSTGAYSELTNLTWENSADKFIRVYNSMLKK